MKEGRIKTTVKHLYKAINSMLKLLDGLAMKQHAGEPALLFIVGAPRSGTTLAYELITQYFQVGYFTRHFIYFYGMPHLWLRLLGSQLSHRTPRYASQYGKISGSLAPAESRPFWYQWFPGEGEESHFVNPEEFDSAAYDDLHRLIASLSASLNKPLVFKNLYLNLAVGTLAQIFPEARFVFLHRDPIMNIQSLLKARMEQPNPEKWWSVKPPDYRQWADCPLWEQATNQVFYCERMIEEQLIRYAGGRYIKFDYASLCHNPSMQMQSLAKLLPDSEYKLQPDVHLPVSFVEHTDIVLSKDIVDNIHTHWAQLSERFQK